MTGAWAHVAEWLPEAVLGAVCVGAVILLGVRPRLSTTGPLIVALALLALDAAAGAVEYAGGGGHAVAAIHGALTAGFKTVGMALFLASTLAGMASPGPRRRRRTVFASGLAGGLLATPFISLAPVLALAHLACAAQRRPAAVRGGALAAATALIAVVASQLSMAPGVSRLATLHLCMALWAAAMAFATQGWRLMGSRPN